ncbi:urease accessory protein UreE [bacterium]|nr:urease accessory protein UreE [bacterium]
MDVYEKISAGAVDDVGDSIVLDHYQREKGRIKVRSTNGKEVRLFLERGQVLQRGELLRSTCNRLLVVKLAKESVISAYASSWQQFSQACYHLGNRHTRIQIGERWLRFIEDPVLLELMQQLGLSVRREDVEFEPESGAYGHGHAGKSHSHHH